MYHLQIEGLRRLDSASLTIQGWSFAKERDPRSAALDLLNDYNEVEFSRDWVVDTRIPGITRQLSTLAHSTDIPLNADHFLRLWNNKKMIPERWKKVRGLIIFSGDVLLDPGHGQKVLALYWFGDDWRQTEAWVGDTPRLDDCSPVVRR